MGAENMVRMRLPQIGAKDLTVHIPSYIQASFGRGWTEPPEATLSVPLQFN